MSIKDRKFSISDMIGVFCLSLIMAVGAGFLSYQYAIRYIDEQFVSQPKMAVVDYSSLLQAIPLGADRVELEGVFKEIGADLAKLASHGYLILDGQYILSASEDYNVDVSEYIDAIEGISVSDSID